MSVARSGRSDGGFLMATHKRAGLSRPCCCSFEPRSKGCAELHPSDVVTLTSSGIMIFMFSISDRFSASSSRVSGSPLFHSMTKPCTSGVVGGPKQLVRWCSRSKPTVDSPTPAVAKPLACPVVLDRLPVYPTAAKTVTASPSTTTSPLTKASMPSSLASCASDFSSIIITVSMLAHKAPEKSRSKASTTMEPDTIVGMPKYAHFWAMAESMARTSGVMVMVRESLLVEMTSTLPPDRAHSCRPIVLASMAMTSLCSPARLPPFLPDHLSKSSRRLWSSNEPSKCSRTLLVVVVSGKPRAAKSTGAPGMQLRMTIGVWTLAPKRVCTPAARSSLTPDTPTVHNASTWWS